jgi:hypothetical protein
MALTIKTTETKEIHVQGTEITLDEVYVRLEFGCRQDGINIEVSFYSYLNKLSYQNNNYLPTDIPLNNFNFQIDPENEIQGLEIVHEKCKEHFENLGYECVIDLLVLDI